MRRSSSARFLALGVGVLVCLGLSLWSHEDPASVTSDPGGESAVVSRVIDGDTVDVNIVRQVARVRVMGIDAPEMGHDGQEDECGADAATASLSNLLPVGMTVQLVRDVAAEDMDSYGRLLRYVEVSGIDVGEQMVEQGMAEAWYPPSAAVPGRYSVYKQEETRAQASATGLWALCPWLGRSG